ncbi:hypothetical protein Aura_00229 [Pseudomonas phage vB_PpuM-Aura]
MKPSDIKHIPLHTFVKVGVAEYLFLNRSAVSGIKLTTTKMALDEIPSIHVHEITMGKDGIHVGYLFKTPKRVAHSAKSLIFAPAISIDAAKRCEAVFQEFFVGLDCWVTSEGGTLFNAQKYDASLLRPL